MQPMKYLFLATVWLAAASVAAAQPYCRPAAQETRDRWIAGVQVKSFANGLNSTANYEDFTARSNITLTRGETASLTFVPGFKAASAPVYWAAYIDLNKDGDFFDGGEQIYRSSSPLNGVVSSSFTVPLAAVSDRTVLRVIMSSTTVMFPPYFRHRLCNLLREPVYGEAILEGSEGGGSWEDPERPEGLGSRQDPWDQRDDDSVMA